MNPASGGDLLAKCLYFMIISPRTQPFFRPLKNRPDRAEEVEE